MSQSQFSDFASSFYGEFSDSQVLTPPASTQTQEPWESRILRSGDLTPTPVPSSLTRVGSDRRKTFLLYDKMVHSEWVDWWLGTEYGSKSKINWDSRRHTEVWDGYHQVAQIIDGAPKVMCKRCGKILEHPYSTSPGSIGSRVQYHGTSTIMKHLRTAGCRRSDNKRNSEITKFLQTEAESSATPFSCQEWEEDILQFLTLNRLPFNLVEYTSFKRLFHKARSAPAILPFPSADTIRRRLGSIVKDRQQRILRTLPPRSKISIALDCWTSPFSQAFIAITGYFIDADWVYREVLLGFKPVSGSHTGDNLSGVLLETLVEHEITDRVFGLTTDNASNNKTLATALQQALPDRVFITRIPCLAHVIQLSLNQLLSRIKAGPTNDSTETKWTEKQSNLARQNAKQQSDSYQISSTLNKIRFLAVYINASPQRRETFCGLQITDIKIVPIQDVRTRWNSTYLMLRRAKRLRSIFTLFCTEYDCEEMLPSEQEWRQIDYLLSITEPFFDYTTQLSKTRDITAHYVFMIYNKLFAHLEQSMKQLRRKRVVWKKQMLDALEAGRIKLDEYYSQTDSIRGHIYAISTMLAPVNKFQFFHTADWDQHWRDIYRSSFREALAPYQAMLASDIQASGTSIAIAEPSSVLDSMLTGPGPGGHPARLPVSDEISQYLDSDPISINPLTFWKEHQSRFPAIAALARDALSFPATGAGVERLFNTARDICHYRRGRIKSKTIEDLMMFLCTSRFDMEEQEAKLLKEFFTWDEIEAAKEEKDGKIDLIEVDLISDTEEQEDEIDHQDKNQDLIELDETSVSAGEHNAGPDPSLPPNQTQIRASGRKRKSREDDVFEYH
ncbi:uncharacterized protein N7511_008439 [Penicillium nucicola]|uniref:uncharacterized protein n=1 Tax=Penicillium nucicola TaxID=1850975 RepID=UPI0025452727|nr:uncharacterized protein N7511_008439 [Penicillium nucicola]KAJ5751474.1 hypothetical protein N7511_008439 [Penicillium nucicola]